MRLSRTKSLQSLGIDSTASPSSRSLQASAISLETLISRIKMLISLCPICSASSACTFSVCATAMAWMAIMSVLTSKKCCRLILRDNYYKIKFIRIMIKLGRCMIRYLCSFIMHLIRSMMILIIKSMTRNLVEVPVLLSCSIEILFIVQMLEIQGLSCMLMIRNYRALRLRRWAKIINLVYLLRKKG